MPKSNNKTAMQTFLDTLKNNASNSLKNLNVTELTGISETQKEIIDARNNFQSVADSLYKFRNDLYENLITTEVGGLFIKNSLPLLEEYSNAVSMSEFIEDKEINTAINKIINIKKIYNTYSEDSNIQQYQNIFKKRKNDLKSYLKINEEENLIRFSSKKFYGDYVIENGRGHANIYLFNKVLKENGSSDYPFYIDRYNFENTICKNNVLNSNSNTTYILKEDIYCGQYNNPSKTTLYAILLGSKSTNENSFFMLSLQDAILEAETLKNINIRLTQNINVLNNYSISGDNFENVNIILEKANGIDLDLRNAQTISNIKIFANDEGNYNIKILVPDDNATIFYRIDPDNYIEITKIESGSTDGYSSDFSNISPTSIKRNNVSYHKNKERLFTKEDYLPAYTYIELIDNAIVDNTINDAQYGSLKVNYNSLEINLEWDSFIISDIIDLTKNTESSGLTIDSNSIWSTYSYLCDTEISVSTYEKYYETIQKLIYQLDKSKSIFEDKTSSTLNRINSNLEKFQNIEAYRSANDASYDTSIIDDFKNNMLSQLELFPSLNTELDSYNKSILFNDISTNFLTLYSDYLEAIKGLCKGIIKINKFLSNYNVIYNPGDDFGNKLRNSLFILDSAIAENELPISVRNFSSWIDAYDNFCFDGPYAYSQLYLGQELGLNASGNNNESDEEDLIMFRKFVLDSVMNTLKKNLYIFEELNDDENPSISNDYSVISDKGKDIIKFEKDLSDNDISLTEDANYEKLPPLITNKVKDLEKINSCSFEDILTQLENLDNNNLYKYALFAFTKYIFADKNNPQSSVNKIINLFDIFKKSRRNFKTLLCEYYFYLFVRKLENKIIANQTFLNDFYPLEIIQSRYSNSENTNFIRNLLNEYIYLWNFYYSSSYSRNALHIHFIFDSEKTDNMNILKFLYNNENYNYNIALTQSEINYETKLEEIWNKLKEYYTEN